MDNQITQKPTATYDELVAETVLLCQQLPVDSYWCDDKYIYKVKGIELAVTSMAKCNRITKPGTVYDMYESQYNYQIQESTLLISDIPTLDMSTEDEYNKAIEQLAKIYEAKNIEMFQKQCLFKTPTDMPFEDFDVLHDEIIELQGNQYFFYEPMANCFRVFKVNMHDYNGKETKISDWHFYINSDESSTHILSAQRHDISMSNIVSSNKIFPITEFQFNELVEFIENNPNKPK